MIDQSACTKKATVASSNVLTLSRRRYCHGHGGKPDLIWLLTVLPTLLRERGDSHDITERILTHKPRRAFGFATVSKNVFTRCE